MLLVRRLRLQTWVLVGFYRRVLLLILFLSVASSFQEIKNGNGSFVNLSHSLIVVFMSLFLSLGDRLMACFE